jgi:hypothetical protein
LLKRCAKRPVSGVGPKLGAQCTASKTEYLFSTTLCVARFQSPAHGIAKYFGNSQYRIEVPSPLCPSTQRLNIVRRRAGEIQIEYHFAVKRGSLFEILIPLAPGRELAGIEGSHAARLELS